jgi:predicted nucleic acid-binding protein
MRAVLDASAAMTLIDGAPGSAGIGDALRSCEGTLAPDLYITEVGNALWKSTLANRFDEEAALAKLGFASELITEFHPPQHYITEAVHEAIRYRHPVYDLLYVILARRTGAVLITADRKLFKLAAEMGVWVYYDSEYHL